MLLPVTLIKAGRGFHFEFHRKIIVVERQTLIGGSPIRFFLHRRQLTSTGLEAQL